MSPSKPRTPVWKSIADALRADLSEGRYRAGDKLPTEAALADRFGVNRHTVRHAIGHLVEEGLVRTRRGAGAFVQDVPTDYPIGRRVRFHENLLAAGRQPERRVLQITQRYASAGEAEALQVQTGAPVCAYHGLSLADGLPITVFESLFPIDRLPRIEAALVDHVGVTAALQAIGIADYTRRSTRLTAVRATATQALHLNVSEGDPLLRSTSVNCDADGRAIEYGRTWFAGDRVTLTLDGDSLR